MANAEDFIPQEAEIEVDEAYFLEDVKNLADNEEIVSQVTQTVDEYENRFTSQRQEWAEEDDGIWNQADAAFRSQVNDSSVQVQKRKGANEPDEWERAKVGTTQFYRQVTQMASNGYAVQRSRGFPFKYEALDGESVDSKDPQAEERSKKLNLLAKWSMKRDRFNRKSMEFWTQVKKYGNIPVMVEWKHERGRKTIREPVFSEEDPGKIESYELKDVDTVVENRPVFTVLPIESVKADTVIGNIQDQECVIVSSLVGMGDIVAGIQSGYYEESIIENIGTAQQWDGYSGFENSDEKKENRDLENEPTGSGTGKYLKREVFVNVPIDEEDETWDISKNIPLRYRVTMFGNTPHESVIARIERNQEPDDSIPIEMIHANPDDSDILYHISNYEVIRGNMAVETTLLRQIIDNNTLVCKPPLKEISGEVQGNDRTFGPKARFVCDKQDSISEFNIRDISQSTIQVLDYMKEDSNTANSIDKNMLGENFGARTSATEAGTISENSRRPNLVNIEYILDQLLVFVAERYKINWEAYGLPSQVIQITDEDDNMVTVRPTDLGGEYDVVINVLDDAVDDAADAQKMINYAQTIAGTPMAGTVDWGAFNDILAEKMMGTSKFVKSSGQGSADADASARSNIALMLGAGEFPAFTEGMNLQRHLDIYKSERRRWAGNEDQNPNVEAILDRVIEQLEARISEQAQGGGAPRPGQQPIVPEGEANRQALSGEAGGI
jgi:hypothetical protein